MRPDAPKYDYHLMDVYTGEFGEAQAERLLWRAGFGPRPGEAKALAAKGLDGAVDSLLDPGPEQLVGAPPHGDKGRPLRPYDAWGEDHVWWLDRMVRTSRPLIERMTLVWHDWFATSNEGVGLAEADAEPERAVPKPCPRHASTGYSSTSPTTRRCCVWLNGTENAQGLPERELRARDDGALHPRRRPRRLHRGGRPPAGSFAHRLAEPVEQVPRPRSTSTSTLQRTTTA